MMKTPEEIKDALDTCGKRRICLSDCPYFGEEGCNGHLEEDALDYIQQLEAQVPKWISVKDGLPDYWKPVLVFRRHSHTPDDGFSEIKIILRSEEYGMANRTNHYEVTHWMPLPEPPKEEET